MIFWFILGLLAPYILKNLETLFFYIPGYCKFMYAHKPAGLNASVKNFYTTCLRCGFIKRYR